MRMLTKFIFVLSFIFGAAVQAAPVLGTVYPGIVRTTDMLRDTGWSTCSLEFLSMSEKAVSVRVGLQRVQDPKNLMFVSDLTTGGRNIWEVFYLDFAYHAPEFKVEGTRLYSEIINGLTVKDDVATFSLRQTQYDKGLPYWNEGTIKCTVDLK